ncbi:hypothetical protein [Paraburkholderia caballeronis]|uniref:hypothetical protein n=1 Tax=Paraburkholderia caballeronis TaxID=416943 RepID=UPI001066C86C|nr:hypothetical protein [Paraburkholderia caballeronis]TDV21047.1 hypothetical protein C7408_101566 [Paraburkholderia caballeronis]TDV21476.1 hypothetical protein C7406_102376 [Paraburkholderia caballeronis]TDV33515.1 hypothetical protein C7404_101662 [Paraburkholderia caballeronis]TDV37860.1 hypothetical protein C7405_10260 [Paraburkholderia caballeronis]
MLSPHEFATLMLVRSAPDQVDMNRAELDTLLEQQLVALEQLAEGYRRFSVTRSGASLLDTFSRSDREDAMSRDAEPGADELA